MGQLTHPTAILHLPAHETAQRSAEERERERTSKSDKDRDKDKGGRSRATSKERSSRKSFDSSSSKSKSKENVSLKDNRDRVGAKVKSELSVGHRTFWPRAKLGRPRSKTSPSEKPTLPPPPPSLPSSRLKQSKSVASPPLATHTSNTSACDRDKKKPPPLQDRTRSLLDTLYSHTGEAQASPPHKQSSADDSPIDTAVRRIQETGYSARASALQTAGALLARIHQKRIAKDVVCDFVFLTCVDTFKRVRSFVFFLLPHSPYL